MFNVFKKKSVLPKVRKNGKRYVEEYDTPQKLKYLTPVAGRTMVNYTLPDEIEFLEKNLPSIIQKYMKIGVDEFDAGFMDAYIEKTINVAKDKLDLQKQHHRYVIGQLKSIDNEWRLKYLNEKQQILQANPKCISVKGGEDYE